MPDDQSLSRILGIDFGLKRIGLALTDPMLTFAYPYKTILNSQRMFDEIGAIIREQSVVKAILGYPVKESGEKSKISQAVLNFKKELEKRFGIEVILIDERYSSSIAQERILESVNKKSKRRDKGLLDMNAAAVILQDYLNGKADKS